MDENYIENWHVSCKSTHYFFHNLILITKFAKLTVKVVCTTIVPKIKFLGIFSIKLLLINFFVTAIF
jgi:hypothetical protein